MGFLNLLKANYTGSVAQTTGVVIKGKPVIKAKIWSKRPMSVAQRESVRAFESVNRISSVMARIAWQFMGLKAHNILKHNAVARFFSPMLRNHIFEPFNITEIIPMSEMATLTNLNIDPEYTHFQWEFQTLSNDFYLPTDKLIFLVFDPVGQVFWSDVYNVVDQIINVPLTSLPRNNIITLAFIASEKNGQYELIETLGGEDMIPLTTKPFKWTTVVGSTNFLRLDPSSTFDDNGLGITYSAGIFTFANEGIYQFVLPDFASSSYNSTNTIARFIRNGNQNQTAGTIMGQIYNSASPLSLTNIVLGSETIHVDAGDYIGSYFSAGGPINSQPFTIGADNFGIIRKIA